MLQVDFWRFAKRENSTKQPTATAAASYSCLLKTGSGVVSPSLEIATSDNVSQWNYAHIPAFGRYYWVQEWTWNNGQWIAHLECDVLASYKTQIGSSTQYVERAAAEYDGLIVDTLFPTKTGPETRTLVMETEVSTGPTLANSYTSGCYIVGIINNDTSAQIGGVSYYQMTYSQLALLKQVLLSDIDYMFDSTTPASEKMKSKTEVNPFQYIVSCKWMAINFENDNPVRNNIPLGWWNVGITGKNVKISDTVTPYIYAFNLSQPNGQHPQAASRGKFLNCSPYTKYTCNFAPFGVFNIPSETFADQKYIQMLMWVDVLTGAAALRINTASFDPSNIKDARNIYAASGSIAVDVQLSQIIYNPQSSSVPIISTIGKIGMGIVGTLNSIIPGNKGSKQESMTFLRSIGNAAGLNEPTGSVVGNMGSIAPFKDAPTPLISTSCMLLVDDDNQSVGKPLCKNKQISSLTGYIACAHVEIELPATDREAENVINYMEGGFFYE